MASRALIVEDDADWQEIIREPLESLGIDVDTVDNRPAAKQLMETRHYDLALIDILLDNKPDADNSNVLETAKAQTANLLVHTQHRTPDTKCIIITAYGTLEFAINAFRKLGVVDFIVKDDFDVAEFVARIRETLNLSSQKEDPSITKHSLTSADTLLHIELEKRKRELLTQASNCRREAEGILIAKKNKRIEAKGGRADDKDDEWINKRRNVLEERYQIALSKIFSIDSFKTIADVQLWLERECNDWLNLSVG